MPRHDAVLQSYGHPVPPRGVKFPITGARISRVTRAWADIRTAARPQHLRPKLTQPQRPVLEKVPQVIGARDALGVIMQAARQRRTVALTYLKRTTGQTVVREIEPYSLRYKSTRRAGRHRYLYGFCEFHRSIHSFRVDNIVNARSTDHTFIPRWAIEF
jgi:predicted DNA-binding transcriptional regulator YafY